MRARKKCIIGNMILKFYNWDAEITVLSEPTDEGRISAVMCVLAGKELIEMYNAIGEWLKEVTADKICSVCKHHDKIDCSLGDEKRIQCIQNDKSLFEPAVRLP